MRTAHVVTAGLFGLVTGISVAACSGDTSSPADGCGGRGQAPCTGGPSSGAGGTGNDGEGGASGGGQAGFGNTDAGPPVLSMRDAGAPEPGETVDPDDRMCGGLAVEPELEMEIIPGNILFVFDRSGSMDENWAVTGMKKWIEARSALTEAIDPLQDSVNVGSIFFPDCDTNDGACRCDVPQISEAPQIGFTDGPNFLPAWDTHWNTAVPEVAGRTPLLEGLQAADAALNGAALEGTTHVVVITDGEPNCALDSYATLPEKIAALTALPTAWLASGIETSVVGLPGADSDDAVMILDAIAAAGGTTQHIVPSDPAALRTELAMIIGESVTSGFNSCRIGLPEEPPNPDDVHVVVVENGVEQDVGRDLGTGGGWALAADGSEIVLQGLLCDLAQQGQYEKISIVFGCVEAPPLPPPVPPE